MQKKFLLFLTILCGLSFTTQPASAVSSEDVAFMLNPTDQTITLIPGQEQSGKISITNAGSAAFDFEISARPFHVNSETYDLDFSANNIYTQLYSWISFTDTEYHIDPGATAQIEFKINVPAGTAGGGQYAAIVASARNLDDAGAAVQVIPEVASLIYGRIEGPEMLPEGEIAEQTIPGFLLHGPLEISETVYNTGNVDFKVSHSITITDAFSGDELFNQNTKDSAGNTIGSNTHVVLPGTSRKQTLVWDNTPRIGVVKVKQTIMYLDQEVSTEQLVIFCPLWLILSVLGLILLAVLWIVLAARHRKRKAPQVF